MVNMKTIKIAIYSISLFGINNLYADEISAPIRDVVVYPDRAMVTREINIKLPSGKQTLRFSNANSNLDPNSLRAESKDGETIVLGIHSQLEKTTQYDNQEVIQLEKQIQSLENQKIAFQLNRERLNKDIKGINEYSKFLTLYISETSTVESQSTKGSWEDGLKVLTQRRNRTQEKLQSVEQEEQEIEKKMNLLREKLSKIQSKAKKSYRTIDISIQRRSEGNAKIQFSYMVPNAGWKVSYSMHYDNNNRIRIQYLGNIKQETGEDWTKVNLFLSTSQPSLGGSRTPLLPIRVSGRSIEARKEIFFQMERESRSEDSMTAGVSDGESPGIQPEEPSPETGGFTSIESSGEKVLFRIPRLVSLTSSKKEQIVTIAEFDEKIEKVYHKIVPSIQLQSHFAIQSKNTKNFPFLKGRVNLFRDSGYIGNSSLAYTAPNQEFNVGFGMDRSLKIERSVKTYQEESGTLQSGKFFHTGIETELMNESDENRKISLMERIPVSQVEEIQVDILDETTKGYKKNSQGIIEWDLTIPKRSKKKFILHYRVKTPSDFPGSVYGK